MEFYVFCKMLETQNRHLMLVQMLKDYLNNPMDIAPLSVAADILQDQDSPVGHYLGAVLIVFQEQNQPSEDQINQIKQLREPARQYLLNNGLDEAGIHHVREGDARYRLQWGILRRSVNYSAWEITGVPDDISSILLEGILYSFALENEEFLEWQYDDKHYGMGSRSAYERNFWQILGVTFHWLETEQQHFLRHFNPNEGNRELAFESYRDSIISTSKIILRNFEIVSKSQFTSFSKEINEKIKKVSREIQNNLQYWEECVHSNNTNVCDLLDQVIQKLS